MSWRPKGWENPHKLTDMVYDPETQMLTKDIHDAYEAGADAMYEARKDIEKELLDDLQDLVNQHCYVEDAGKVYLDSMALSANADAMRLLARHNRLIIDREGGRKIIAHWQEQP